MIGIGKLIEETVLDGYYVRFALVLCAPLLFCVALVSVSLSSLAASSNVVQFFCITLVTNVFFMLVEPCLLRFFLTFPTFLQCRPRQPVQ